jgi:hypothetical protein
VKGERREAERRQSVRTECRNGTDGVWSSNARVENRKEVRDKKWETKNENKITFKDMYKFSLLCISFHKQVNNTPWLGNVMQRCVIFTDCIKSTHNGKEVFVLSPYSLQNNHFRSICGSVLASRADELILAWSNVIPALHEAKHKFRIFLKHKLQYKSCSIYDTESRSYWNLQL